MRKQDSAGDQQRIEVIQAVQCTSVEIDIQMHEGVITLAAFLILTLWALDRFTVYEVPRAAIRTLRNIVTVALIVNMFLLVCEVFVGKGGQYFMVGLPDRGLGIALKCADGTSRASRAAVRAVLGRLDVLGPTADRAAPIENKAGNVTGELRPVFGPGATATLAAA